MTTVLVAFGVFVGVLAVLGGLVVWRIRRAAARWRGRFLGWREAVTTPGPKRDATRLRRTLQDELVATERMLEASPDGLVFRADAAGLLAEIGAVAGELDRDLRAVEGFADVTQQRAALARLGPQVDQVVATSYSARQTMLRTAVEDRDRALASLRERVDSQAAAVQRYTEDRREFSI